MDLAHIPGFLPSRAQSVQYSKYKRCAHNQSMSAPTPGMVPDWKVHASHTVYQRKELRDSPEN